MGAGVAPQPPPGGLLAGFLPHPLVSFGLALPTGCESLGEYLDLRLDPAGPGETPIAELPAALSVLLPEGIAVQAAP